MDGDCNCLLDFMVRREFKEEIINTFATEKIDCSVVINMKDEDLAKFLPRYGDRFGVKQYCQQKHHNKNESKLTLLEKLRNKIKLKSKGNEESHDEERSFKKKKEGHGNIKTTGQIEMGWMCSLNGKKYTQVRTKCGGGTRIISVPKCAKKDDLIAKGIELFFPDGGVSTKGSINKFSTDLLDFKSNSIPVDITVEELFIQTSLNKLRFYLATTEKCCTTIVGRLPSNTNDVDEPLLTIDLVDEQLSTNNAAIESFLTNDDNYISIISADSSFPQQDSSSSLIIGQTGNKEITNELENADDEITFHPFSLSAINTPNAVNELDFQNNVDNFNINELLILPLTPQSHIQVYLHRGQIFNELIDFFCNHSNKLEIFIQVSMILPNGEQEVALDSGGVFRDVLSEFWSTFFETSSVGTSYKIPSLRHDFDEKKWKAIASILYQGWFQSNYYPISLAPVFMEMCILGDSTSDLRQSFLNYISVTEKEVLEQATNNEKVLENDVLDDLVETLSNYDCKVLPTTGNLRRIVDEIAHKELIQKPMYVIDCWREILKFKISQEQLESIYAKRTLTSKNVISLLYTENNLNAEQQKTYGFLKRYIREADIKCLKAFLRFTTGADVITDNKINVTFNTCTSKGLSRTPIAHTCGCVLELSSSYDAFPELRTEFNGILFSNIWVMDIA